MKLLRNEKGIALVMVLIFSLIGLAIVSAMLFMLTQGTRISGSLKIYKSGDEAGLGGTFTIAEMIKNKGLQRGTVTSLLLSQLEGVIITLLVEIGLFVSGKLEGVFVESL